MASNLQHTANSILPTAHCFLLTSIKSPQKPAGSPLLRPANYGRGSANEHPARRHPGRVPTLLRPRPDAPQTARGGDGWARSSDGSTARERQDEPTGSARTPSGLGPHSWRIYPERSSQLFYPCTINCLGLISTKELSAKAFWRATS